MNKAFVIAHFLDSYRVHPDKARSRFLLQENKSVYPPHLIEAAVVARMLAVQRNITDVGGLTEAKKASLKALETVEDYAL